MVIFYCHTAAPHNRQENSKASKGGRSNVKIMRSHSVSLVDCACFTLVVGVNSTKSTRYKNAPM